MATELWKYPRLQEWWLRTNPATAELRWREESAVLDAVAGVLRADQRVVEVGSGTG